MPSLWQAARRAGPGQDLSKQERPWEDPRREGVSSQVSMQDRTPVGRGGPAGVWLLHLSPPAAPWPRPGPCAIPSKSWAATQLASHTRPPCAREVQVYGVPGLASPSDPQLQPLRLEPQGSSPHRLGSRSPHPSGSKLLPTVGLRMHRTHPGGHHGGGGGWRRAAVRPSGLGKGEAGSTRAGRQEEMGKRCPYPPSSHLHPRLGPSMAKPTWKPTGKGARGVCRGHPPRPGAGHRGDRRDNDGGKGKQPPQKSSPFLGLAASHKLRGFMILYERTSVYSSP